MRMSVSRLVTIVVWVALLCVVLPATARSADEHGAPKHGEAAHGAGGHTDEHANPRGGVFPFLLDLGIWTILVFLLLVVILGKYAWGPMLEGLKKREENILGAIEDARKARVEAEKVRAELQAEMNKAAEKVREILDEARRDAKATSEEMIAKARSEIGAERDRLRREIQIAEDHALHEIWNQAVQLAATISTKTIERSLTPEDHRKFVDEALQDLHKIRRNGQRA